MSTTMMGGADEEQEEQAAATALMRRRSRPQRWSGDAKEVVSINQPRVHRRIWMSRLML
jgi:hypothetical protein